MRFPIAHQLVHRYGDIVLTGGAAWQAAVSNHDILEMGILASKLVFQPEMVQVGATAIRRQEPASVLHGY
jgi:hypothetical protein